MEKKLLMGNEAIALGALRAGISLAVGYPGTPSTEIIETIAKQKRDDVYVEWSVNEKAALEVAAGAAYAGARVLVTMKQVGLNVASDPLMSLNYVGVVGGVVIVVADDPGPISSQTEQDTRAFAGFAKLALFDPASPEEAYEMVADAFEHSEKYGRPVLLRPTTRVCHGYATVTLLPDIPRKTPGGFRKDGGRFVIFPRLTYQNHIKIEAELAALRGEFSSYRFNTLSGCGTRGIAAGGVSYAYARDALEELDAPYKLIKVSTVPFPEDLALRFLEGLDEVLVCEELDPVIERNLLEICGKHRLNVAIRGKLSGDVPCAGENTLADLKRRLAAFLGVPIQEDTPDAPPALPVRPPVLCAGCPHRASFFAVKEAAKGRKAVFSGDIGCYTLGNAQPLDMVDTCLCMGAGITIAQGLHKVEPDAVNFAFIGDSTFFHTGVPGLINAVYNRADIIVAILDNRTTAMTGNQPHPGIGKDPAGREVGKLDIYTLVQALGVDSLERVNAFDFEASKAAAARAMDLSGVRVLLFEGACIAVDRGKAPLRVAEDKCTGCKACARRLGCPALSVRGGVAVIDQGLCTGCGLCANVCAFGALGGDAS